MSKNQKHRNSKPKQPKLINKPTKKKKINVCNVPVKSRFFFLFCFNSGWIKTKHNIDRERRDENKKEVFNAFINHKKKKKEKRRCCVCNPSDFFSGLDETRFIIHDSPFSYSFYPFFLIFVFWNKKKNDYFSFSYNFMCHRQIRSLLSLA